MDGDRNNLKRKEPKEAFDLSLQSGNRNSTEQAESSNSQANNEAGCSSTPGQQNQVNPELGFAMLAGENQNLWRNIRQRINGPPFGSSIMNSNVHLHSTEHCFYLSEVHCAATKWCPFIFLLYVTFNCSCRSIKRSNVSWVGYFV